ncbi:FecR family protein [Flavitalea flava]
MEDRSRLDTLFAKLLDNSCSPEESDELVALFSAQEPDRDSLQLLYEQIETPVAHNEIDPDLRRRLQKRLEQILANDSADDSISGIISVRFRWIAAAVFLLIIGMSASYWHFYSDNRLSTTAKKKESLRITNDIPPGSTKAILTLGNGQKIVLDNTGNGVVAEQGNMNVLKLANGRLAYQRLPGNSLPGNNTRDTTGKAAGDLTGVVYNTLTTPRGGQYQLTLPDGTKVWLDASSSIIYPTAFVGTDRKVEIKGQVYFEVAKDEKLPFIVKSRDMIVLVLGTRFNLNAYEEESVIKTTLLDGSVRVMAGNNGILLDPGQQAQLNNQILKTSNANPFIKVVKADMAEALAWKNGFFSFRHADIQTVMRQLCRWYNVEVKYQREINKEKSFSGEIGRNLSLADVLNGLQLSRIHYRIEADKRLVILP